MWSALVQWARRQGDRAASLDAAQELLELRTLQFGPDDELTINARLSLMLAERLAGLTDAEWKQVLLADELHAEAAQSQQKGQLSDAAAKLTEALAVYNQLVGRDLEPTLTCQANLVVCLLDQGQFFRARPLVVALIDAVPRMKGPQHSDTVHAVRLLGRFNEGIGDWENAASAYRQAAETVQAMLGADRPESAIAWTEVAKICIEQGHLAEADSLLGPAFEQLQRQLGEEHLVTAQVMKLLGGLRACQCQFDEAEPLLRRSVGLFQKLAGERHLATAGALNALGRYHVDRGQLQQAAEALTTSFDICREILGEGHPTTGKVVDNLARLHELAGNTGTARQLRMLCLQIAEQSYGENNLQTAEALEDLSRTYMVMNDFGLAETYLLRARQIRQQLLGVEHPSTAGVVGKLAYVYLGVGDPQRAEPLFRDALSILDQLPGADPLVAPRLRKQLALLYQSTGRFDQAAENYRTAIHAFERAVGPDHVATAEARLGLAQTQLSQGQVRESCALMDAVLETYQATFREDDARWVDALAVAGSAHLAAGHPARAGQLVSHALRLARDRLERMAAFESERQRLAQVQILRNVLDLSLSASLAEDSQAESNYRTVFSWKGATSLRQWSDRQRETPDSEPIAHKLHQICQRLGTLTLQVPEEDQHTKWMQDIFELSVHKENLEQQRAAIIHQARGTPPAPTVDDLRETLPDKTVLLDFLQYTATRFEQVDGTTTTRREPRFVAFVVRKDGPVVQTSRGWSTPARREAQLQQRAPELVALVGGQAR